jgi:hypothetical protein
LSESGPRGWLARLKAGLTRSSIDLKERITAVVAKRRLDDETLEELWSFNVGTGINSPPIAYEVNGKQYIAIATGLTRNQVGRLANSPETRSLAKHATMLFVFGL